MEDWFTFAIAAASGFTTFAFWGAAGLGLCERKGRPDWVAVFLMLAGSASCALLFYCGVLIGKGL